MPDARARGGDARVKTADDEGIDMKSIMAALLLTAAIASPVLARGQVPFRGSVEGMDSDGGSKLPVFLRSVSGVGHATASWSIHNDG